MSLSNSSYPPPPLPLHCLSTCPVCLCCPSTFFHPFVAALPPLLSVSIPSFSSLFPSFCVLSIYPHPPSQSTHLCHSLSLCTALSPLLRSMVGCVSCVWTRPRKPSARPWGSSCSRRWSYSMPTRARSRCRPRRSTSASCRSWNRRCRCAGLTWNKRLWMKHSYHFKRPILHICIPAV